MCHIVILEFTQLSSSDTRRITYENTSASIIEIIATKEAVHPLKSLDDLRNRLSAGRKRVFSVFHKLMPNQPLVFVHVSLESEVPSTMSQVMDGPSQIKEPSVAVFYSISNGHRGLAGVGLGEFLLKEAVKVGHCWNFLAFRRQNNGLTL